jgi:hypothetical protein
MKTSQHETEMHALVAACGSTQAAQGKPWMIAVWIEQEDRMVLHRTTWGFPLQRMTEARELLRENMAEEICPHIEPLPLADFLANVGVPCCEEEGMVQDETA